MTSGEFAEIVRAEWPRVVATLVGDLGDLADAEDALQDAVEQALEVWPREGIPDRPGAWLTTVARRRAIDRVRRASRGREKAGLEARLDERLRSGQEPDEVLNEASMLRDEQLRLVFACCHPSLSPEAQMALTLRSLCGLSTGEIARAFVVPEATVAQRLVRAKKKISGAAIPFRIPPDHELLARTKLVREVIYLVFNEGYERHSGPELLDVDMCVEAIRLAALLADLTPDDPESLALYALLLLIHSRSRSRVDANGDLILLPDQDRALWNSHLAERGEAILDDALRLERPGPLQLQAAIQALHTTAPSASETDWPQIELLYRRLGELEPSPVVYLNHAVAIAMTGEIQRALFLMDSPTLGGPLDGYAHYHSARADLLRRLDQDELAAEAYHRAHELVENEPERRFLERRLAELSSRAERH